MADNVDNNVSHIEDENGNLLWAPNSLDGAYTLEAAQSMSDILKDLLKDISIKASIEIDEDSLANVYTKTESDQRFIIVTNFDSMLNGKIQELINSQAIIGSSDLRTVNSRLLSLYTTCYGTNFDGVKVINDSYNQLISNLRDDYSSQYTIINRLLNDIYGRNTDGSTDWNNKEYALVSNTGTTSDLSSLFVGANRASIVSAVNYIATQVGTRDLIIGSGVIQTTAKDLIGAVNELLGLNNNLNQSITNMSGTISTVSSNISSLNQSVSGIQDSYISISGRVSGLENQVGTGTLNTDNKTVIGAINELDSEVQDNKSDIDTIKSSLSTAQQTIQTLNSNLSDLSENFSSSVQDISNAQSDIEDLERDTSSLNTRVGNLEELDSDVSGLSVVESLNVIASTLKSLSSSFTNLETRVKALEDGSSPESEG